MRVCVSTLSSGGVTTVVKQCKLSDLVNFCSFALQSPEIKESAGSPAKWEHVRPGQFQTGPLGLGPAIEESLGSPAKQEQGSQSDRVCTENKQQYSPGNTQNGVLSRAGLM